MFRTGGLGNEAARPGPAGIEIRSGIFPPPHLVALRITSGYKVRVAVPVDVVGGGTGLNGKRLVIDDAAGPPLVGALVPHDGGA